MAPAQPSGCLMQHAVVVPYCRAYTACVSSKKGGIGFDSPPNHCDVSRSHRTWSAAFDFVPPVLAARMGGRKPCRFTQVVPGLSTRSSRRLRLTADASVVANRTAWRPFMADHPAQAHSRHVSSPAATLCSVPADHPARSELIIGIRARACVWWRGTAAQLQAEGLIPDGFEWPEGDDERKWGDDCFEFLLCRRRPPGRKGRLPRESDYWQIRQMPVGLNCIFGASQVYEKRRELEEALWRQTPAYRVHARRYWAAHEDLAFQAFKNSIPGLVKPQRGCKSHG